MGLPANFYIPRSAQEPAFYCRLCGETIRGERSFGLHIKACSDAREEQMREHTLSHKNPWLFDPKCEDTDVEFREYVRRTGNWH